MVCKRYCAREKKKAPGNVGKQNSYEAIRPHWKRGLAYTDSLRPNTRCGKRETVRESSILA